MVFSNLIQRVLPAVVRLARSVAVSLAPAKAMPEPRRRDA